MERWGVLRCQIVDDESAFLKKTITAIREEAELSESERLSFSLSWTEDSESCLQNKLG